MFGVVVFGIVGCSETNRVAPPGSTLAPKPASKLARHVMGQYKVKLSPKQIEELRVMQFAFLDPIPTDEDIAATDFTDLQKAMVAGVVLLRQKQPNDPELVDARKVVAGMHQSMLEIASSTLSMAAGDLKESGTYEILSDDGSTLTILMTTSRGRTERIQLRPVPPDTLLLTKPDQSEPLRFERAAR